jgi:ATP-dependent DNA helicase RecG
LGLSERQLDALSFFRESGEITSSEYAQKYKITDRTARADLADLVEKELLSKRGETKSVIYVFP